MSARPGTEAIVQIPVDSAALEGALAIPPDASGLTVFAHGSGSSRLSPRNQFVAAELRKEGLATLLFDLLTEREDSDYRRRFDIALLTERLKATTEWLRKNVETSTLPIGYFGASTGAAAALRAAAALGREIGAVVSRGGRVDLAESVLGEVGAPTLLIVGENDDAVLELNRRAYELLQGEKKLAVVAGATHLFEEPGALEEVARLSADWFKKHLRRGGA
ncbi:MAG TPA: dienelactone hydrolase family protein [Vicinamibacteria bacterium]